MSAMAWRKWLWRMVLLSLLASSAGGYYLYSRWTDPKVVRAAVLAELRKRFPGALVRLQTAQVRLLGGIQLVRLELCRREDPGAPLAAIPNLLLQHDRQQLTHGKLVIRKMVLQQPSLRLIRYPDGTWNVADILGPTQPDEPLPRIDIEDGTLTVIDQATADNQLVIRRVNLTLSPMETPFVHFRGTGQCDALGELHLEGTANRQTGEMALAAHAPNVLVNAALMQKLGKYIPELQRSGASIEGRAAIAADVTCHSQSKPAWSYALRLQVADARLLLPDVPFPIEDARSVITWNGGTLKIESLEGKIAGGQLRHGSAEVETLSPRVDFQANFDIAGFHIREELYSKLPADFRKFCTHFRPNGPLDMSVKVRKKDGKLSTPWTARLRGVSILFDDFPYPVEGLTGTLVQDADPKEGYPAIQVNLVGRAGQRPVRLTGRVFGNGLQPDNPEKAGLQLDLRGDGIPIDQPLMTALLPAASRGHQIAKDFQLAGRVSFLAQIRRQPGSQHLRNVYVVHFHDASLCHDEFPYPLEQVTGRLDILPDDRWQLSQLRGKHGPTEVSLEKGQVILKPDGGFWLSLEKLKAEQLRVDDHFLRTLPGPLHRVGALLRPDQPIRVFTNLIIDCPGAAGQARNYAWDGYVRCDQCKVSCGVELENVRGIVTCKGTQRDGKLDAEGHVELDEAVLFRQPLREVRGKIEIADGGLVFRDLRAELHGGALRSLIRITFGDELSYELGLKAENIDLARFRKTLTRDRAGQVQGKAAAQLALNGRGSDLQSLRGRGRLDIPEGAKLYDLPLIVDLLKFLSGKVPDGTAFEEAHAHFYINGERMEIDKLELLGDAISLRGKGTMNTNGSNLSLEMYGLIWGRTLPLMPVIDWVPPQLSKWLMKIRIQGDLAHKINEPTIEPVPIITEPLRELLQSAGGRRRPERMTR